MVIVLGLENLFSEKVVWRSATYHTVDTLKHNHVDEQSIAEFCILQKAMVGSTYHCATAFLSPWCFILKTSKNNDILTFCTVFWLFLKDCAPCKRFWSASQEEASWRLSPGLLEMTLLDWIRKVCEMTKHFAEAALSSSGTQTTAGGFCPSQLITWRLVVLG